MLNITILVFMVGSLIGLKSYISPNWIINPLKYTKKGKQASRHRSPSIKPCSQSVIEK